MGGSFSSEESESRPRPLATGISCQLLAKYALGELLDEGAYGRVFACRPQGGPGSGRAVEEEEGAGDLAVKLIDKADTPMEASLREAEVLKALTHPNIVGFHEVFSDGFFVCIVMDKYNGGNLLRGMELHQRQHGRIECQSVIHIFAQAAIAVQYLHGRLLMHRDVKGDNFLLDRPELADPECRVALGDFDTACHLGPTERLPPERSGTKKYWAPERFGTDEGTGGICGQEGYGYKADVWALGVVLYTLLAGHFPFADDESVRTKEPKYSKRLHPHCEELLRAMLEKREDRRLSAAEVLSHRWICQWPGMGNSSGACCPTRRSGAAAVPPLDLNLTSIRRPTPGRRTPRGRRRSLRRRAGAPAAARLGRTLLMVARPRWQVSVPGCWAGLRFPTSRRPR